MRGDTIDLKDVKLLLSGIEQQLYLLLLQPSGNTRSIRNGKSETRFNSTSAHLQICFPPPPSRTNSKPSSSSNSWWTTLKSALYDYHLTMMFRSSLKSSKMLLSWRHSSAKLRTSHAQFRKLSLPQLRPKALHRASSNPTSSICKESPRSKNYLCKSNSKYRSLLKMTSRPRNSLSTFSESATSSTPS
jgi:hypothetical protein